MSAITKPESRQSKSASLKKPVWQHQLAEAVTDAKELLELLQLDPQLLPAAKQASDLFKLRVPRGFVAKMQPGNPNDPLLRQVLPLAAELKITAGFSLDPLAEQQANKLPGLLHKYHGRVLLVVAGACAINCRYCFRRHFPYQNNFKGMAAALDYIAADPSIEEVIYSGGDPLLATDEFLTQLTDKLAAIAHVKRLRVHTRLPIVLPTRITESCLDWLTASRLKPVMVLHCNHANEIDAEVQAALAQLQSRQITLLNQAVLLKGVNDSLTTLVALSQKLFTSGVMPYYLHQLDKVQGAAHFAVSATRAQELYAGMRARLPGYLVPKLACELPGAASKQY